MITVFNLFRKKNPHKKQPLPARPVVLGEDSICLDGRVISYTLKRSYRAKLIWLSFKPDSGLQVTVPQRYNLKDLPAFLKQHASWILRHQAVPKNPPDLAAKKALLGDSILILGKTVPIVRRRDSSRNLVSYDGDCLLVEMKTHSLPADSKPPDQAQYELMVYRWLNIKAQKVISARVEHWSALMEVTYNRISVRNQHSRWGSCSQLRNLSFNWRLIMVPEAVLDYVVIHELCHLQEMNHQKTFWKTVAVYCPSWPEQRRWLNQHRVELHAQFDV